jgi:AcrR family transcriptional regulator
VAETAIRRGRATREQLIEAAAELIPEVGWGGVTTRIVAERAGVNQALVHYHFSSVSDLLVEAVVHVGRRLAAAPGTLLADAHDIPTGVATLLRLLDSYSGTDPESLLLLEAFLASTRNDRLRAELNALLADFRSGVVTWLAVSDHPDPAEAAVVLAAAVDGLMLHRAVDKELDLSQFRQAWIQMLTSSRSRRPTSSGTRRTTRLRKGQA